MLSKRFFLQVCTALGHFARYTTLGAIYGDLIYCLTRSHLPNLFRYFVLLRTMFSPNPVELGFEN